MTRLVWARRARPPLGPRHRVFRHGGRINPYYSVFRPGFCSLASVHHWSRDLDRMSALSGLGGDDLQVRPATSLKRDGSVRTAMLKRLSSSMWFSYCARAGALRRPQSDPTAPSAWTCASGSSQGRAHQVHRRAVYRDVKDVASGLGRHGFECREAEPPRAIQPGKHHASRAERNEPLRHKTNG